ncbi:MAG TPA: FtsX-like permease family protein, partial [Bacteroidales bacterium]|nr:FtsX-like permease family protein [Bacteroidales bacterium]
SGSSVMLVRGNQAKISMYAELLTNRFSNNGIYIERTTDRLASFYEITNTYLSVFGVFGGLGIITGVAGLGFVLLRNYNSRKREFALLMATGFSVRKIRKMISSEQIKLIVAGVVTGAIPAFVATLPSLRSNHSVPWTFVGIIILLIFATGYSAIMISMRAIKENELTSSLRKE